MHIGNNKNNFFFFRDNYNMLLTPQLKPFSPLNRQALCAWGSVNSTTRPLTVISTLG